MGRNQTKRYNNGSGIDTMSKYSNSSSQMMEYWDLLSIDDAKKFQKDQAKEREAKILAQRHLK